MAAADGSVEMSYRAFESMRELAMNPVKYYRCHGISEAKKGKGRKADNGCGWQGNALQTITPSGTGLPVCPECGKVLLEVPNERSLAK